MALSNCFYPPMSGLTSHAMMDQQRHGEGARELRFLAGAMI